MIRFAIVTSLAALAACVSTVPERYNLCTSDDFEPANGRSVAASGLVIALAEPHHGTKVGWPELPENPSCFIGVGHVPDPVQADLTKPRAGAETNSDPESAPLWGIRLDGKGVWREIAPGAFLLDLVEASNVELIDVDEKAVQAIRPPPCDTPKCTAYQKKMLKR